MNRGLFRSSILQTPAANGSITLTTPVTTPHGTEQCPLPDSSNYSDPLRGSQCSANRWENRGVFIPVFGGMRH
ncbi:Degenerin del-1 [Dissostichus eleginoides]|uniref:Degenerin del-1 n=1 Tax=Dissostichus eleginoides TaxID=100907 RepID=A0AAD9BCM0_DISEL|nr:Degenerin del-1 [Dissostichus eleginoides]